MAFAKRDIRAFLGAWSIGVRYHKRISGIFIVTSREKSLYKMWHETMNEHLQTWILQADLSFHEQSNDIEFEDALLRVGCKIFPSQNLDSLTELAIALDIPGTPDEIGESLVIQMLVYAVSSEDCENREDFVRIVLNMDEEAQVYLMNTIQSHLSTASASEHSDNEEMDVEVEEDEEVASDDKPMTPFIDQSDNSIFEQESDPIATTHFQATTKSQSLAVCGQCQDMRQRIEQLHFDMTRERSTFECELTHLKNALTTENSKLIDFEVSMMQKEHQVGELRKQVEEHDEIVKKVALFAQMIAEKELLITELRDELDLNRGKIDKYNALEKSLQKMKEKMSDLNDVREQLKTETSHHSETYNKLIEAEKELHELRDVSNLVEEYRKELAEKMIMVNDLTATLHEKELEFKSMQARLQELEAAKAEMASNHSHLTEELTATNEQLRAKDNFDGLGAGMSEFNPALMKELSKLRSENTELLSQLDRTSLASFERINKELTDQKAMVTSLQSKWSSTKQSLAQAQQQIEQLQQELFLLNLDYQAFQSLSREQQAMLWENISSMVQEQRTALHELKLSNQAATDVEHAQHSEEVKKLTQQLNESDQQLQHHMQRGDQLDSQLRKTQNELNHAEITMEEGNKKRKLVEEKYEEAMSSIAKKHRIEINHVHEQHNEALAEQQSEYEQKVQMEQQRVEMLQNELEMEVAKRRKVERLKKLYESESQRQKLQLQNIGAGGEGVNADGYDAAAKEIRSMQEKLDEANAEVHSLKMQLASASNHHNGNQSGGRMTDQENAGSNAANQTAPKERNLLKPLRILPSQQQQQQQSSSNFTYAEQAELHDKRIEQLSKEKRELLTKSLEENKEKMELSQRVLALDKENTALKAELRKRTLEKERLERNLLKTGKELVTAEE